MRVGRTLPPAAAPIRLGDVLSGFKGATRKQAEIERFVGELKQFFACRHCFLLSSGKAALTVALQAFHDMNPERDEVVIPAFTCYSVPSAIVRAGLKVRPCDSDPITLDFDFDLLERMLRPGAKDVKHPWTHNRECSPGESPPNSSPKQKSGTDRLLCVVATHLFGCTADVERLRKSIADPRVVILEDAAQTMGAARAGTKAGTMGDISILSLGRGKAFTSVAGGILLTNHEGLAARVESRLKGIPDCSPVEQASLAVQAILMALFTRPELFWLPRSFPFLKLGETLYDPSFKIRRFTAFQAGMTRGWQDRLDVYRKAREDKAQRWASLLSRLSLEYVCVGDAVPANLIRFPVRMRNGSIRKRLLEEGARRGLGIMPVYPGPVDRIPALSREFGETNCPKAKTLSDELVTLPVHPFVSEADARAIASLLCEMVAAG
jgi:perosamine synthetase